MYKSRLTICIIFFVQILYSNVYANDLIFGHSLRILENTQKYLYLSESSNHGCDENTSGELLEIIEEKELSSTDKKSISPIHIFRKDYKLHYGLRLKNDIFASPVSKLRYGSFFVFDLGETHGTEVNFGLKMEDDRKVSYLYETNLYTQRSPYPFLAQTTGFFQDYTSEQIHQFIYDNLESNDLFTYEISFGALEYVRDNDDDFTLASTQQKLLHNHYDTKYLGSDYYEVENHHKPFNESGLTFRSNLGLSATSINEEKTQGQHGRIYIAPELSTLNDRNNVTLGLSYDTYVSAKNQERELPFGGTLPKDALRAHVGFNVPLSFHQIHGPKSTRWSTNLSPELKLGLSVGDLEFGYSTSMVFGTLPNYIPENRSYTLLFDNEPFTDHGDMGEMYFRLNKKF